MRVWQAEGHEGRQAPHARHDRPEGARRTTAKGLRVWASSRVVLWLVGSGHSSSPLVETGDVLVSTARLAGLDWHDLARHRARLGGTTIHDAGEALLGVGLGMC